AGGAVGVAVGDVVAGDAGGLGHAVFGVALALGTGDHAATDVALVGLVADHATGDRTGRGGGLLAAAAADLVADQAADDRAGHGAADVAIALGQALLHHHVLADLVGHAGLGRLTHRFGADHRGVDLLLLRQRLDAQDLGELQASGLQQVVDRCIVAAAKPARRGAGGRWGRFGLAV